MVLLQPHCPNREPLLAPLPRSSRISIHLLINYCFHRLLPCSRASRSLNSFLLQSGLDCRARISKTSLEPSLVNQVPLYYRAIPVSAQMFPCIMVIMRKAYAGGPMLLHHPCRANINWKPIILGEHNTAGILPLNVPYQLSISGNTTQLGLCHLMCHIKIFLPWKSALLFDYCGDG